MERSENLTPEPICNENTSDFVKLAGGDGAQEIGTVTETDTDTVTDDLDRETGIPTTMLTPPPTSEPLLLNGSSRSSSDLQQFTGEVDDEINQVDNEHSNHSTNSDSIDSKSLIINEAPDDSTDNVSDGVDRKIVNDYAIDTCSAATVTDPDEDKIEEEEEQQQQQQQSTDDNSEVTSIAVAPPITTETEQIYDECSSRLQSNECDTNSQDEITPTDHQVITNKDDNDDDIDNDVIPTLDGDSGGGVDSRQEIESTSLSEIEMGSDVDTISEQTSINVVGDATTVPLQSINGMEQSPSPPPVSESAAAAATVPEHEVRQQWDEPENCLANELHIEHKKLKRKLSTNSADDSCETLKKQTKYDQTATAAEATESLDSNEIDNFNDSSNSNSNNQIDVVADLTSNHVTEHNQIPVRCDSSSSSSTDIQHVSDSPKSIEEDEGDKTQSIGNIVNSANEMISKDADADADENGNADTSANVDSVHVNLNVMDNVDDIDVLPATKDTIHNDDDDDGKHEHKFMNGHINNQMESIPMADNANDESYETATSAAPQQQYKQQQTITHNDGLVDETNESEFTLKIAPSSPSSSFLSSSTSSLFQSQSQSQTQQSFEQSNDESASSLHQNNDDDDDDGDDDDEHNLVINDTNNLNSDTDPVLNKTESNQLTEQQYPTQTHTTTTEQQEPDITENLNCSLNMIATTKTVDGIVENSIVDTINSNSNLSDIRNTTPSPQPPPLPPPPPSSLPLSLNHNKSFDLQQQQQQQTRSIKSIDSTLTHQQSLYQLTECNQRNSAPTAPISRTPHHRPRRQVFLCSACGTYYEKWNLFYHIREVHNKFICLFENCLGVFSSAEKLVMHLESKHVHSPLIYEHTDDLLRTVHNQCFLMCCDCEHIFTENDVNDVSGHVCETFKRPCVVCGLKSHKSNCSALNSRKANKLKSKRSTMIESTTPMNHSMIMPMPHSQTQPQPQMHLQSQPPPPPPVSLIQINSNQIPHPHQNHMVQQQTFLRNALLGQESRLNQHHHSQSGIATSNAPMLVNLPIPPHSSQVTMSMQQHHQQHQPHPLQQFSTPYPVTSFNGNIVQPPSVPKLFMNSTTTTMIDTSTKYYNPNQMQTTNANMYNVMYNASYQNLPNGQYTQNQFETRYSTPNTLTQSSTPTISSMATAPTTIAYQQQHHPHPHPHQQQQQPHQEKQQRFQDMAANMQTYDESSESPKKNVRFVGSNHSNSGSSSNSDSNNDSDSSSNDSDVEKDDKENHKKMLVKPLRINLNSNKHVSNEHGSLSTSSYMNVEQQNDSANENETIDDQSVASNTMNASKYHSNMSDITNIQMRLDNIQQQMNAMQKTSTSQQQNDDDQMLKVPKLKLKLSKPFEKPIESEQSSTDSDSGSDNENENDDEENDNAVMGDMSTEMNSNDLNQHHQTLEFSSDEQQQQQQQHQQHEQYPYDENSSLLGISNDNFVENANESESSAKNTSTDSIDDKIMQHADDQFPPHFENDTSTQMPSIPMAHHELHANDESTTHTDINEQENFAVDTDNAVSLSDNYNSTNIEPSENNIMTQFERSTQNDQPMMDTKIVDGNDQMQLSSIGETIDSVKSGNEYQPPVVSEHEPLEIMDIPPVIEEDRRPITEFILDQPLDKIPITDFLRTCLQFTYPNCLYCNHARSIAVNGVSLAEHLISDHRFRATVDSITAEELLPETIEHKISSGLDDLHDTYFNMSTYDSKNFDENYHYVKHFECFQCRFASHIYKDLYLHNRKMHLRSALICLMCRSNFYSYSELVCHMCPGAPSKLIPIDLKFRCVLCNLDEIPSAFRLMVHIRKKHSACDVCLDECYDQSKLSSHVWKHKLHHLCYRCNITYRNKADITRHLFWKHGTESVMCKRCLEKKWPHVYHFCVPPSSFKCELCAQSFSKAITLKVHKRMHDPDAITFACTLEFCDQKFISKKLMIKHVSLHYMPELPPPSEEKELLLHPHGDDENDLMKAQNGDSVPEINSPTHRSNLSSPKPIIDQEAPIDAVISVIEHDARERQEQEKLLKKESSVRNGSSTDTPNSKSKSKKLKRNRSDFSDLLPDLPSLNLSESDSSSGDSDLDDPSAENSRHSIGINNIASSATEEMPATVTDEITATTTTPATTEPVASNLKPKLNNQAPLDDDDENKAIPLEADIWENFKTYQANQMLDKALEDVEEDRLVAESVPILLHVSQSDHDYPLMYKRVAKRSKVVAMAEHQTPSAAIPIIEENDKGEIKVTVMETAETTENINNMDPQSPAPLPASTITIANDDATSAATTVTTPNENKKPKGDSDSSSDSSGSDSDSSSCSCGSNCSCTSSSSSSSSSSGSGSDSSSSESKRKQRQKVLTKTRKSPSHATPERRMSVDENEMIKAERVNSSPKREGETSELITAAATTIDSQEQQTTGAQTSSPPPPPSSTSPPPPSLSNVDGEEEKVKLGQLMHDESENVDVEKPSDIDVVDVVTTDKKHNPPNVYTMIVESDLETTEPDTDEEFYDEHPQKLAIQMLAEKRQQLMLQTLNPVNGMPYMSSTSRPATPLLLEEVTTKGSKGGRTKKRRRTCKNARSPQKHVAATVNRMNQTRVQPPEFPISAQTPMKTILANEMPIERIDTANQQASIGINNTNVAVSVANFHFSSSESPAAIQTQIQSQSRVPHSHSHSHSIRLSTSSCSDADSSLKRSKRRRIPNRFYGYTSDDESMSATSVLNSGYSQNPFKPTPPPNLTWSKDDLPKSKPTKGNRIAANTTAAVSATAGKRIMRKIPKQRKLSLKSTVKAGSMKNRTLSKFKEKIRMGATMPTVPKIIIRGIPRPPQSSKPSQPQQPPTQHHIPSYQAPDLSSASRIPNAPVHHMSPPSSKFSDDQSNQSSDSESDTNLQISQPFRSNFGSISKLDSSKNDRYQQQQQQQQQQQMPFIRPDHTLLPLKPKSYSPSLSPSPPPQSAMLSTPIDIGHTNQPSSSSSMQQQPAMFNGGAQYRSSKQENSRNESLYCYCQQPYDEREFMIGCDANDCAIEWFHFKCVGITEAPQDKWFCPQCQARNQHPGNFANATNVLQNRNSLYSMGAATHPLPQQPFDLA